MMEYYQLEGTSNGIVRTSDEAKKFADEMFHRLTSDEADGHFMPQKAGSRNSVSDHIDHSRVLELEKYPLSMAKLQDFLEDDLDAMLVKYFDGTSRRIAQTEKFGVNAHGFYDYMYIAEKGVQGIADLLGKNKTFRKNFSALGENGHMEDVVLEELVAMPFATKPMMATRFASALVAEQAKNGSAVLKKCWMILLSQVLAERFRPHTQDEKKQSLRRCPTSKENVPLGITVISILWSKLSGLLRKNHNTEESFLVEPRRC